ncbi:MerR family transcriptional regulator [Citreimonas sp.]|uniref:MerR family transcriptional regulator n=1 Tax=Citreimonas sp. TaxID=3036715 RepID=UPI004059FF43
MDKSPDAFRTISEVADWLQTPAHVLRFWESKFAQVKPVKRAGGRRYYRPADMLLLGGIKKLLHDDGMTIKGVQKMLREQGVRHVARLSVRKLEGADAEAAAAGFDDEIEDAPFVEVEAPEPEERLIAFPSSASRQPTPKPDLPPDPPPTPGPDLPDGPGDIATAEADDTAAAFEADGLEDAADEPAADEDAFAMASDPAAALDDVPPEAEDDADDATQGDIAFDAPPETEWAAQDAKDDAPAVDLAEDAWDAHAADEESPDVAEVAGEAETDEPPAFADEPEPESLAKPEPAAEPLEAALPPQAPASAKPGPIGRLAWLDSLTEEQSDAVRAALPALRALHERLAASTAGEQ